MSTPKNTYDKIVTVDAVRARRDETGEGMMICKAYLERKAMRQILNLSNCDPGVRFILERLIALHR